MSNKTQEVLAVGSVALDTVTTPFGKAERALGGSVTYFSASARFFSHVSIVAVIGDDFPEKHRLLFKKLGVDTSDLKVSPGKTFHWEGLYSYDLNNPKTLKTDLNVFQHFKPVLSERNCSKKFVFLANVDPEIQLTVLRQVKKPLFSACDSMNFWIENKRKPLLNLLKNVDIFLCNDGEARELSGEFSLIQASKWILSRGPKLVVIKKGEHGVTCFSKKFMFMAPAYPLEQVFDPTGAGDTFAGGFIGYLTRSHDLNETTVRKAVIYGSVLASYNVESFSLNRLASLRMNEIQARYKHFRELTKF